MCNLSAPRFHDPEAARQHLEGIRWPDGPMCPHCGSTERIYAIKGGRSGLRKCGDCHKQFTVTVGTLFQGSHVPLNKWLMAVHLLCSSKKGMSSHQIHRTIRVTYKTAWFMIHRIREAMKDPYFTSTLGGGGGTVEADETFWGNVKKRDASEKGRAYQHKKKVFSLVERRGKVHHFHVPSVNSATLVPIMVKQIAQDTDVMTDEARQYLHIGTHLKSHGVVNHRCEDYARGPIHTNTLESYFSIFKHKLVGTYHHVAPKHLKRYVGPFGFRYNARKQSDAARADSALKGIDGKRLTYRRPVGRLAGECVIGP